ncbi:MAG: ATP-binding cassette domain-containing protein [Desulfotomaculaceae bacterium]|nr:ATP-binding cassette domain-containing protein [Desulfotomaculaceae bacterium]
MADFFCFDKISYLLGSSSRRIEVSASLQERSVLLVKGPSGSGKSTLLRVLSRLQELVDGQVFFRGVSMRSFTPQVWRSKVHYVPQKPAVFPGTVYDNLQMPYNLRMNKSKQFDLEVIQRSFVDLMLDFSIMGQNANTLSGGETARIALLRSVILKPNILLLDEPTAALDENAKQAVLDFLTGWLEKKPDRGIVLVSHADESTTFPAANILEIGG